MKRIITSITLLLVSVHFFSQTPNFIKVEGGSFEMGNIEGRKDEKPVHNVSLKTFEISRTPITVSQYRKYCKSKGVDMPEAPSWGWSDNNPIVNVSWSDAVNYCTWLSSFLGKKITLPTEAQWEYAARGGNKSKNYKHSGGRKMNQLGWCRVQEVERTQPVKAKKPNELGIYDMNGNVWEWCIDWYRPNYYAMSPKENPENKKPDEKRCKVARGGGWDSEASTCTVTHRKNYIPKSKFDDRGFRVVRID